MKILVCVDGSNQSYRAAEKVSNIVKESDKVYILHSYINLTAFGKIVENKNEAKKAEEEKEEFLNKAAKYFKDKGKEPETVLKEGHPVENITDFAKKNGIDLIVMGNKGTSGLREVFIGSVSNSILQKTDADVMLIK